MQMTSLALRDHACLTPAELSAELTIDTEGPAAATRLALQSLTAAELRTFTGLVGGGRKAAPRRWAASRIATARTGERETAMRILASVDRQTLRRVTANATAATDDLGSDPRLEHWPLNAPEHGCAWQAIAPSSGPDLAYQTA